MAYKRKYKKGPPILSLDELSKQTFIYHDHQLLHHGWFMSWQTRFARQMLDRRCLYYAEKVGD